MRFASATFCHVCEVACSDVLLCRICCLLRFMASKCLSWQGELSQEDHMTGCNVFLCHVGLERFVRQIMRIRQQGSCSFSCFHGQMFPGPQRVYFTALLVLSAGLHSYNQIQQERHYFPASQYSLATNHMRCFVKMVFVTI